MYLNGFPMMIIGCCQLSSLKMVMKKTRHRKQQQSGFKSNMKKQRENRLSLCEEAFQIFWLHCKQIFLIDTITAVSKPAFQLNSPFNRIQGHGVKTRLNRKTIIISLCPNVSTTHITAMGCQQCLPCFSVVQLKGKHCRKPHCRNGVVDMFRL